MFRILAATAIGFLLPPAICFGEAALMVDPVSGIKGGTPGMVIALLMLLAAPFAGYAFIALPFARWRDLDRPTMLVCVGISALYWAIYTPLWVGWLVVSTLGWSGSI